MKLMLSRTFFALLACNTLVSAASSAPPPQYDILRPATASLYDYDDPKLLTISITDCKDKLVDATKQGIPSLSGTLVDAAFNVVPDADYRFFLRQGLVDRIKAAQVKLNASIEAHNKAHPDDDIPSITICLVEGYRSPELQNDVFHSRLERARSGAKAQTEDESYHEAACHVAPLRTHDSKDLHPGRCCGALATLAPKLGIIMGNNILRIAGQLDFSNKPDKTWMTHYQSKNPKAHTMRRLMVTALQEAGMVNTGKIQHWGFGDRYSALINEESSARYGVPDKSLFEEKESEKSYFSWF